jgi:uncharacterized protein DUF397
VDERELTWRKSSRSGDNGGGCVEIAKLPNTVMVRDSKDPAGPVLAVTEAEWVTFLHSLR